ncbi:unnamed protein product [Arctogadus glacialis]
MPDGLAFAFQMDERPASTQQSLRSVLRISTLPNRGRTTKTAREKGQWGEAQSRSCWDFLSSAKGKEGKECCALTAPS